MTAQQPEDYSEGYGKLVRAYRNYMGLSQRTLSYRLNMREASLSDIEVGRRRCPKGFIDTVENMAAEFDTAVQATIQGLAKTPGWLPDGVPSPVEVSNEPSKEWERAVTGRAAVESGLIRPVLVSQRHP